MRRLLITIVIATAATAGPAHAQLPGADLAAHVNPMIGTHPPGFVVPGAATPFGMVQNSPDTRGEFAYSGYLYEDPQIQGFSLVHLSGPGVKKGGDVPLMPVVGPVLDPDPNAYGSPFDHGTEQAEAGYYRVRLSKYLTDVELTASTRAAMQRYTFPPTPQANVVIDVGRSIEGTHAGGLEFSGPAEVRGFARGRYPVYFVARFSRPFASTATLGAGPGGVVSFDTTADPTVTVRVGVSFVDMAGAERNLDAEAPTFDFEGMRARARSAWNDALGTIRVDGGTDLQKTSFYTALYHAQLHPNVFEDVDGRYRGFDDKVHDSGGRTHYSNFSLWDTYKGENQLLATIQPRRYREMLLSLLADHGEGGRLPRWKEQSIDPAHMSGDPAIPMIADGVCRGLVERDRADDLYAAAEGLVARRDANLAKLGYLPDRPGTTLEYGGADFALALLADVLGRGADATRWREESLRYRKILDPETKWVRPRAADGTWHSPFDPTDETGFQEGNSWQYSWLAPHDARGLFDRMEPDPKKGGDAVAVERLDQLFAGDPNAQNQATFFGIVYRLPQYAPGNEHDIQIPWMYPFAGQPWKTAKEHVDVRSVFRPTLDGLPGNDDLGGLSGWYVWSALGIGPVTPGAPFLVFGSPQFERASVRPDGGTAFRIEAPGASATKVYPTAATLGGRQLGSAWLYDASLRRGETLRLTVAEQPDTSFGSARSVRPPSASDAALERFGCVGAASAGSGGGSGGGGADGFESRPAPVEPGAPGTAALKGSLRVRVSPGRARSGRRTRFRFVVTMRSGGRPVPVRGATVRFAGRKATTSKRGTAKIWTRVHRRGMHRASASAPKMRRATARVRVR